MLAEHLKLVPNIKAVPDGASYDKKFLLELLVTTFMHFTSFHDTAMKIHIQY